MSPPRVGPRLVRAVGLAVVSIAFVLVVGCGNRQGPVPGLGSPGAAESLLPTASALVPSATVQPAVTPAPTATPVGGGTGLLLFASYRDGESDLYLLDVERALAGAGEDAIQRLTDDEERVSQPVWSPDGRSIAYVRRREGKYREIWALDLAGSLQGLDGRRPVQLVSNFRALDTDPAWSPQGGQIAFASSQGSPISAGGDGPISLDICFVRLDGSGQTCLTEASWPLRQGVAPLHRRLAPRLEWNTAPAWSPAGDQIAFQSDRDGNNEIYRMAADGTGLQNLTRHPASDASPAWSPKGDQIAFVSDRDGNEEIYLMDTGGTHLRRLTGHPGPDKSPAWSPDGQWIAFHADRYSQTGANFDLHLVRIDGSQLVRLTSHLDFDGFAAWQPAAASGPAVELPSGSLPVDGGRSVPPEIAAWLQETLIPLDTLEPAFVLPLTSQGFEDLAPLAGLLGQDRIVDLGGANFGYHEALSGRHRIFQYLVTELGFNSLVLDVSQSDAVLLNDYIRTGTGDAAAILAGLDDVRWNSEEIRYLIEWLRLHNQDPGGAPAVSLCSIEPDDPAALTDLIVASLLARDLDQPDDSSVQSYYDYLSERQRQAFEHAGLCTEQAGPGGKYVLWAYHFRALATYAESDYLRPLARRPLAAWALGAHLGEEPYVIGFAFGEGWLTAYDSLDPDRILGDWLVPAPPPHSFEWTVRRSGPQAFLLPLDGVARDDPGTAWLAQPLLMRDIIGVYQAGQPDEYFAPVRLATAFDAIVYVDGATPLQRRWGR